MRRVFPRAARLNVVVFALLLAGCASDAPKKIDPSGDKGVTSMGADYREIVQWSQELTERMLADGFLDQYPKPVPMAVSTIENKTNISQFPKEIMLGRIRAKLRSSGKVKYVSTYGEDATDTMVGDTQELRNDPRFKATQVPKEGEWTVGRLTLRTQILYLGSRANQQQQNTYEVRMFVSDVQNGEVVWEGFSDPIAKVSKKGAVGW
jgi:PBP1b-binding outer membrane lipoprotein LpoB